MKISRVWCMPSHKTFSIKPIKCLIEKYRCNFIDPFPFPFKQDAVEFLINLDDESCAGILFDPPYSQRQLTEMYASNGLSLNHKLNSSYWSKCRDEIARVTIRNGIVISFGWNSSGIGKTRGFEIVEILIVAHGGMHNDTICTVEKKISGG